MSSPSKRDSDKTTAAAGVKATASTGTKCSPAGSSQVQLLSVPQLDSMQRTLRIVDTTGPRSCVRAWLLRIVDVRLQHIQSNVKDDVTQRTDIENIRKLMTDNQNELVNIVTMLSGVQEDVRRLSISVRHQTQSLLVNTTSSTSAARGQQQPSLPTNTCVWRYCGVTLFNDNL